MTCETSVENVEEEGIALLRDGEIVSGYRRRESIVCANVNSIN